jgi:hypothetical protein
VSPGQRFPFAHHEWGYPDLVETRMAQGRMFAGPSAVWFRMSHPLVMGQTPSPYQRVAVAADSGNGISAILDLSTDVFVNSDVTVNPLRKPGGERVCLDARPHLSVHGGGGGAGGVGSLRRAGIERAGDAELVCWEAAGGWFRGSSFLSRVDYERFGLGAQRSDNRSRCAVIGTA